MANPLFNALGGAQNNGMMNMMQQYQKFRQDMHGKDPREEINKLLQSGKINQQQLNQIQEMARQFKGFLG